MEILLCAQLFSHLTGSHIPCSDIVHAEFDLISGIQPPVSHPPGSHIPSLRTEHVGFVSISNIHQPRT